MPWLLSGLLLSVLMILLGPIPRLLVAIAILACAWYSGVDSHALLERLWNTVPRCRVDRVLIGIFALLAFDQLCGFAGLLLALPASAIISIAMMRLRLTYLKSSFHNQL